MLTANVHVYIFVCISVDYFFFISFAVLFAR